jgi:hypothetical protein
MYQAYTEDTEKQVLGLILLNFWFWTALTYELLELDNYYKTFILRHETRNEKPRECTKNERKRLSWPDGRGLRLDQKI